VARCGGNRRRAAFAVAWGQIEWRSAQRSKFKLLWGILMGSVESVDLGLWVEMKGGKLHDLRLGIWKSVGVVVKIGK